MLTSGNPSLSFKGNMEHEFQLNNPEARWL